MTDYISKNKETLPAIGRFRVATDCVVFGLDLESGTLKIVLVKRKEEPFLNHWSLPGGFVRENERTEEAARRVLKQKTGLENIFLEQLYTFDDPLRDPRSSEMAEKGQEPIISVGFFALVSPTQHKVRWTGGGNVNEAQWFAIGEIPQLGRLSFDHNHILEIALTRLRGKLSYVPIGFELLERKFTIKQLQRVYEIVIGHKLDSSNFRRRALRMGILEPQKERQSSVSHRPAQLYRFNEKKYRQLVKKGFDFEL